MGTAEEGTPGTLLLKAESMSGVDGPDGLSEQRSIPYSTACGLSQAVLTRDSPKRAEIRIFGMPVSWVT